MAQWKSEAHLRDHFRDHRAEFPGTSFDDFDASAQDTLTVGTYFEYQDDSTEEWRTGCYHRETRRLTILDENDLIISHFRCSERYVESLTNSTYG
jgi:hypothetical protein